MPQTTPSIPPARSLRCDILGLCFLFITAVVLGLLINQFREKRLPLVYEAKEHRLRQAVQNLAQTKEAPSASQSKAPPTMLGELTLQEFRSFVNSGQGFVFDARPEIFHRLGHVPRALSFPRDDFENAYQKNRVELEADKSAPIVIYCSGKSCEDSKLVRSALVALGHTQVGIFSGGWAEWSGAGLTVQTTP
jgi:3-mercaptopyruvate sulfurtransferase SseA